jgi:hypothetical protein
MKQRQQWRADALLGEIMPVTRDDYEQGCHFPF